MDEETEAHLVDDLPTVCKVTQISDPPQLGPPGPPGPNPRGRLPSTSSFHLNTQSQDFRNFIFRS